MKIKHYMKKKNFTETKSNIPVFSYPNPLIGKSIRPKPQCIKITQEVYREIETTIGALPEEQGGMLGSSDGGNTIDHFYWDTNAATSSVTYSPNTDIINRDILPAWNKNNVRLVGFVHSHPKGFTRPSGGDLIYVQRLLEALDEERFVMPIVQVDMKHNSCEILGYTIEKDKNLDLRTSPCDIKIVVEQAAPTSTPNQKETLDFHSRVEDIYPLAVMRRKTVIVPGCGGAGEYIENIARTGIGKIILLDGDTYSETNLSTQSVYRDEIGKNKALALKERIHRIDPAIEVIAIPRFLDDSLPDSFFEKLLANQLLHHPTDILMTACTDSFPAQARCAKLALKYGLPFMAAQLYQAGQASEVIFTYPGVTPSCPRCLLSDRYKAFLKEGYTNTVGSQQTPIFATQRTNSLKGYISLMLLLYHEVEDNPFYSLLDQVRDRNFINIRMTPNFDSTIFTRELGSSPYTFFDESLWITQSPDNGQNNSLLCPECHGIGNLSKLKGHIPDTRVLL